MQSESLRDRRTLRYGGLLILLLTLPVLSQALPTTNTTLTLAPSQSVSAGEVVALTASVTSPAGPVIRGQVFFCNADAPHCLDSAILGTAQLTAAGTAQVRLRFGVGAHRIKAAFRGTPSFAPSASALADINATGTIKTTATLSSNTGTVSRFKLTTTVSALGSSSPEGGITLTDLTNHRTVGTTAFTDLSIDHKFAAQSAMRITDSLYAAGDFNNDGLTDLMVVGLRQSELSFYEGHPDGTLTRAASPIPTPTSPQGFVTADFNGDGNLDVATGNFSDGNVSIFLGNGNGTFFSPIPTAVDLYPYQLITGDWNGDGIPDLINISKDIHEAELVSMQVLLGEGDGTFVALPAHRSTVNRQFLILAADFNGDGYDDIAVSDNNGLGIQLSKGNGTFAPQPTQSQLLWPSAIAAADFNGDGLLDLVTDDGFDSYDNGKLKTYLGDGKGTLTAVGVEVSSSPDPNQILVGDLNGDGISDIIAVNSVNVVAYGIGDGTFHKALSLESPNGLYPGESSGLLTDWNGDGAQDLFLYNGQNQSMLLAQTQTSRGITVTLPPGAHSIQSAYAGDGLHEGSTSQPISVTASLPLPVFSPTPGPYKSTQIVRITDVAAAGSTIYYTLDGSTPTTASAKWTGDLNVGWEANIKAIAYIPNVGTSQVVSGNYSINRELPQPSPNIAPGTYKGPLTVSLDVVRSACFGTSCDIYYTLDGSAPTIYSIRYTAPIVISKIGSNKIRAATAVRHYTPSPAGSFSYVILP